MKRKINKGIIGSRTPEYTLVENPPMDDRLGNKELKSSDSLKQEVEIHNFLYISTYGEIIASFDTFDEAFECMCNNFADSMEIEVDEAKEVLEGRTYFEGEDCQDYIVIYIITQSKSEATELFDDRRREFISMGGFDDEDVFDEDNELYSEDDKDIF